MIKAGKVKANMFLLLDFLRLFGIALLNLNLNL